MRLVRVLKIEREVRRQTRVALRLKELRLSAAARVIQRGLRRWYSRVLHMRALLRHHGELHSEQVLLLQRKWRAWRARPKKLDVPWFKAKLLAYFKGWRLRKIIHHPKLLKLYQEVKDMLRLVLDFKRTAEEGEDTSNRREFINQIQCKYLPSRFEAFHKVRPPPAHPLDLQRPAQAPVLAARAAREAGWPARPARAVLPQENKLEAGQTDEASRTGAQACGLHCAVQLHPEYAISFETC